MGKKAKWGVGKLRPDWIYIGAIIVGRTGHICTYGGMIDYNNGWDIYGINPINIFQNKFCTTMKAIVERKGKAAEYVNMYNYSWINNAKEAAKELCTKAMNRHRKEKYIATVCITIVII
jgi:hypothetical protein